MLVFDGDEGKCGFVSAENISQASCCPSPCGTTLVENIPGPQGVPGVNGNNGTNGVDAFTLTTAAFVQPAIGSNVTVSVLDSTWIGLGQILFLENGGSYSVSSIPTAVSVQLNNLGYTGNAAPATNIPSSSKVSPGGGQGGGWFGPWRGVVIGE